MGCSGFRRGGISALELQALLSAGVSSITLTNGTSTAVFEMLPNGAVEVTNIGGTGRVFNLTTSFGGEFVAESTGGVWSFITFGAGALEVNETGAVVSGDLSAGLLSRTPVLPPWDDSANPTLTAADTGGTFRFTGTATLPNPATLDEGWTAKLLLGPGAVVDSPVSGQIVYAGDGGGIYSFAAANVVEQASDKATMVIECDGTNFIVTAITGQIASV